MPRQRDCEPLRFPAQRVLRQHVDGVLHRVREDDLRVVTGSVRGIEITAQPHGHVEFLERVRGAVAQDLEHAHAGLAVLVVDQFRAHRFLFTGCPVQ